MLAAPGEEARGEQPRAWRHRASSPASGGLWRVAPGEEAPSEEVPGEQAQGEEAPVELPRAWRPWARSTWRGGPG